MTDGWTARPCPHCHGTGVVPHEDRESVACPYCGGTGNEWGKLPEPPVIEEPRS